MPETRRGPGQCPVGPGPHPGSDFYQSKPRAVDAPRGRRTDIITYIINNITIKGNYEPTLLLQIINVYL